MRVTLCSRNAHKARELEALLPGWSIETLDADDSPPETGDTYYENATPQAAHAPRGSGGFGYDPIFVPDGEERTVAELGDDWKTEHSHRARAARALLDAVERSGAGS